MTDVTDEDRRLLVDAARTWVRRRAPTQLLRDVRTHHAEIGFDPERFAEMSEMGWTGTIVPETFGGYELGFQSMGLLAEELGRTLTPSPLIASSVAAASALILGGSPDQKQYWLPRLASGECIGSLAVEEGRRFTLLQSQLSAERQSDKWVLNGRKQPVDAGMAADFLIVAAQLAGSDSECQGGIALFIVPSDAAGMKRIPLQEVDTRGRAAIVLEGVELSDQQRLGTDTDGKALLEKIIDRTAAVTAAEMLGAMTEAFDITVAYLRTRVQFGKVIGSFQALQHRAADMVGEIGLARAAVYDALRAIDADDDTSALLVSVAKIVAGRTFLKVAREMVQMHGGIGMTDEHDAGLYLKRAHASDMSYGNIAYHRERAATLIGI